MTKKKQPRLRYEVRFEDDLWRFCAPDGGFLLNGDKKTVVDISSEWLTTAWSRLRVRSELTIKTKTGKIQDKRTYGEDPPRTKG